LPLIPCKPGCAQAHADPILPKTLFVGLDGVVAHLCAGGEAPVLCSVRNALNDFVLLKGQGMSGRERIIDVYRQAKELLAAFVGATSELDLAFLGSASDGINVLASGVRWRPGDNVVSLTREYPSSLLPWLSRRTEGVELRTVEPRGDPEAALAAAIDERTRIVCVSHVSYLTGLRLDLERLADAVHARGAILAVDASHSLGVVPVPVRACDVVVSCCYKFLLGVHGAGVFYWNRERLSELAQPAVGWHSVAWPELDERASSYRLKEGAQRFELGNPSFVSLFALREALRALSVVSRTDSEAHVLALGKELRDGLVRLGLPVLTPEPPERRAGNIVFADPDAERVVAELAGHGVLAWSGDGRIRFSLHAYNDASDVAAALDALAAVVFRGGRRSTGEARGPRRQITP
jgi:cysteine desulfurase/selenocysteine lyase